MKKESSFWQDLESYTWKVIERLSPALPWLGLGIIVFVIATSAYGYKASLVGAGGLREAALRAAKVGDYVLAQDLWEKQILSKDSLVLGAESEVEDRIYPERVIEREITKYQELLTKYPSHRDIYLVLARLYDQIGESEQAQAYLEMARELDPNNAYFGQ